MIGFMAWVYTYSLEDWLLSRDLRNEMWSLPKVFETELDSKD